METQVASSSVSSYSQPLANKGETTLQSFFSVIRTVRIAEQKSTFTSAKYFAEAGVGNMGVDFKAQFVGFRIPECPEIELAVRERNDDSILVLPELEKRAVTPVTQFREFLAKSRESEPCVFYLLGNDGQIWSVSARWREDSGLRLQATVGGRGRSWRAGKQIVSRN